MKLLAATILSIVCATSVAAVAANKKAAVKCSAADKKAGKCGHGSREANQSTTTAAATSVRKASMESSRAPASVMESNTH